MKNLILALAALVFVCAVRPAFAGFQKTEWGDTPQQVIAKQGIAKADRRWEKHGRHGVLWTTDQLVNQPALVVYIFVDKKLVRVKVVFTRQRTNANGFLSDFASFEDKLTRVYGEPVEDNTFWSRDLYRDRPEKWGMALLIGDLSKFTRRDTADGTEVWHGLTGGNYEVQHLLEYVGKAFLDLDADARAEKAAEDL